MGKDGEWVFIFLRYGRGRGVGACAPRDGMVLDVLAFSHSGAARQPRGLVRFRGSIILKGRDAIKDWAHGLGARGGRLCESESGHCSAHLTEK